MDREPPKGSKWPAEGPHYTWGSTRGTPGFLWEQTEFQIAWVRIADWCEARCQVPFLAAAVLGLTWPTEEVGTFALRLDMRQNP